MLLLLSPHRALSSSGVLLREQSLHSLILQVTELLQLSALFFSMSQVHHLQCQTGLVLSRVEAETHIGVAPRPAFKAVGDAAEQTD